MTGQRDLKKRATASRPQAWIGEYVIGDARRLSTVLPAHPVLNVTITSPPYWNLKNYGSQNQVGFGQSYETYLADLKHIFEQVWLRTHESGGLWMVMDTFKQDGQLRLLPFDVANSLTTVGWRLQDVVIWQKDRTLPWSHQGKLRNIFEYVMFFSKSRQFKYHVSRVRDLTDLKDYWVRYPERYSPEGKTPSRSWNFPIPRQGSWGTAQNYVNHACPLPIGLVQRMVELTSDPGDMIFDPFAGSGTVLAVAHALDRKFCGIDLNRRYRTLFLSTVLKSVNDTVQKNGKHRAAGKPAKATFSRTIMGLRALKQPREMLRLYRKTHGNLQCRSIVVLPGQTLAKPDVFFVLPKARGVAQTQARFRRIASMPPLSKYGVAPDVKVVQQLRPDLLRKHGVNVRTSMFRYPECRFYLHDAQVTMSEVIGDTTADSSKCSFPPLFSTIKLAIKPAEAVHCLETPGWRSKQRQRNVGKNLS